MNEQSQPAGLYYDRQGRSITMEEWANETDPAVNRTIVSPTVIVSTRFYGQRHTDDDPPLLFETRVFGGRHDRDYEWYTSEQEARQGHDRWVSRARRALREDGDGNG